MSSNEVLVVLGVFAAAILIVVAGIVLEKVRLMATANWFASSLLLVLVTVQQMYLVLLFWYAVLAVLALASCVLLGIAWSPRGKVFR